MQSPPSGSASKSQFIWWIVVLIQAFLAPTRLVARFLRHIKFIESFKGFFAWNSLFYILLSLLFYYFAKGILIMPGVLLAYFIVIRIDELVAAFYGDGVSKEKTSKLSPVERVWLLSLAYIETLSLFAALYVDINLGVDCAFDPVLTGPFEAFYLSVMTITTTGYGDLHPIVWQSRLAAMYEALVGIIFIALALAAYISNNAPEKAKCPRHHHPDTPPH